MTFGVVQLAIAVVVWLGATTFFWRTRRWLMFYLTGAFGFVLIVMFAALVLDWDTALEALEARQTIMFASASGLTLDLLGTTGLAIRNHTGWAVFDIGIECSALLEMSAIIGLTLFYPAFSKGRRIMIAGIGLGATYIINLMRILLIVAIIDAFGTAWVFSAHAVFGRVFFFILTVALYWFLVTRPTLGAVRARVEEAMDE